MVTQEITATLTTITPSFVHAINIQYLDSNMLYPLSQTESVQYTVGHMTCQKIPISILHWPQRLVQCTTPSLISKSHSP